MTYALICLKCRLQFNGDVGDICPNGHRAVARVPDQHGQVLKNDPKKVTMNNPEKLKMSCRTCGGSGTVCPDRRGRRCPDDPNHPKHRCPDCGGRGRIEYARVRPEGFAVETH